ncbi:hypothetical protein BJX96DRAFT_146784 [Aspergillus floccosus]
MTTTIASFHGYAALSSTSTSSSSAADFTGKADYPVFPNAIYLSKFYLVSSQYSGLTDLDIDLYNECYLPARALPYHNHDKRDEDEATTTRTPKPDYQLDSPPCKRQAAINANCYYQDTNGTFAGLEISNEWEAQQQCYCDIYPFFDSARGCQECFKKHGGIEGYHWFPESYISAASSSYCSAEPQTTGLYPFVVDWAKTNSAADVASTTASDLLGTQTAANLYYTYAAATAASDSAKDGAAANTTPISLRRVLLVAMSLGSMLCL